jgi:hypothetical protein
MPNRGPRGRRFGQRKSLNLNPIRFWQQTGIWWKRDIGIGRERAAARNDLVVTHHI